MPSANPHPATGDGPVRRLGKYELVARIGEGGMAEVHLARMRGPMNFEKLVVVKTIHPELASQDEFLKMLLDEARLSALIRHPSVVDIYDLGQVGYAFFIAMEYLDGQPLSMLISAAAKGYALEPCALARILGDAAGGLHAAHELTTRAGKSYELVHRDVSPGNIMVLYDGGVKILDFGIAKARGRLTHSGARQLKGKLGYASPEQLMTSPVDRRSDVFSLGVVLWETLARRRLFPGDELARAKDRLAVEVLPPSVHSPQVPPALDAVCLRALQVDPAARFQTAAEMKQALDDLVRDLGTHREKDDIAAYMTHVFARKRSERALLLNRRSNTASEPAITLSPPVVVEDPSSAAKGTPAPAPAPVAPAAPEPPARRRAALPIALGLLVLGAGGGAVIWKTQLASGPAPSATPAAMSAGEALEAPAVVAPPEVIEPAATTKPEPKPEPEVEPKPEPEPEAEAEAETEKAHRPTRATKSTRSADELYQEGADLFVKGNVNEAKQRFKDAIAANPRHAPSHRGLGLVYQAQGKKDKAIASFKKYLALSPGAPDAASIRQRLDKLEQ